MIKLATLCYVREGTPEQGRTLMLHRIKKANDMHAGKWNGLGGKLEPGETPEECAIREVREESGLHIIDPVLRGIITFPQFNQGDDWYTYIFVANRYRGELIDSNEGVLAWVDNDKLFDLNLWPGDHIFMSWLDGHPFFSAKFVYTAGELVNYEVLFYTQPNDGYPAIRRYRVEVATQGIGEELPTSEAPAADSTPVAEAWSTYRPEDDTYCWMCGGPVDKRNCKIVCLSCGFMRDCSDP